MGEWVLCTFGVGALRARSVPHGSKQPNEATTRSMEQPTKKLPSHIEVKVKPGRSLSGTR